MITIPGRAATVFSAAIARPALSTSLRTAISTNAKCLAAPVGPSLRRSYHEKVLDHYNNPRNVGSMGKNEANVGTGLVGAPACGDVMKLQIKVDPNSDTISDVKFKTFGCGSAIASSSYLTELVRGMTLDQAGRIRNTEIAKELCLPPVKCESLLQHLLGTADSFSALFHACRGCDQVCHLKLLHQEPKGQKDESRWNGREYAKGREWHCCDCLKGQGCGIMTLTGALGLRLYIHVYAMRETLSPPNHGT